MGGYTEIQPQSLDDLAFRLLLQEIVRTGDPDLCDVTEVLICVSAGSRERTAKLHSRCAMTVVDVARWLPTVTPQEILDRAIAVDVEEDVIEDFCKIHSLSLPTDDDADGDAGDEAPAVEMESLGEADDCANCPACRTRALIYRELIELWLPMILPIAQSVVAELSPEVIDDFGGADSALNSMLLTAAEEFGRTSTGSDEGRAFIARNAEELHFNDYEISILVSVAMSLAESSGRMEHRG